MLGGEISPKSASEHVTYTILNKLTTWGPPADRLFSEPFSRKKNPYRWVQGFFFAGLVRLKEILTQNVPNFLFQNCSKPIPMLLLPPKNPFLDGLH